jgi:hypothetical protein
MPDYNRYCLEAPPQINRAMKAKRWWLKITAATAVIVFGLWLVHPGRERRKAAERESYYQTLLAKYAGEFKPGINREQVEQRLQIDRRQFRQRCCVASFRGQYMGSLDAGWDDLVKIGEESTPWVCSENNVYIALEFNPKSKGELPKTNISDILKRVSVFHQLEGCP